MDYRLMHKDIPVAELTLDYATCSIVRIGAIYAAAHLPVAGIQVWKKMRNLFAHPLPDGVFLFLPQF